MHHRVTNSLAFVFVVCLLSITSAEAADVVVTGTWQNDKYGTLTLAQTADRVTGTMEYPNGTKGTLQGKVARRTMRFEWGNGSDEGTGDFILSVNGMVLTGYWESSRTGKMDDWVLKKQ